MKKIQKSLLLALLFIPQIILAQPVTQSDGNLSRTRGLIDSFSQIVDLLIILAAGVALLAFFWGLAKFIFRSAGDEKAVEEGKRLMIWGVIALFVMVSVWGIVRFVQKELGLTSLVDQGSVNLNNMIPTRR